VGHLAHGGLDFGGGSFWRQCPRMLCSSPTAARARREHPRGRAAACTSSPVVCRTG
jgi:hypothetical protein